MDFKPFIFCLALPICSFASFNSGDLKNNLEIGKKTEDAVHFGVDYFDQLINGSQHLNINDAEIKARSLAFNDFNATKNFDRVNAKLKTDAEYALYIKERYEYHLDSIIRKHNRKEKAEKISRPILGIVIAGTIIGAGRQVYLGGKDFYNGVHGWAKS